MRDLRSYHLPRGERVKTVEQPKMNADERKEIYQKTVLRLDSVAASDKEICFFCPRCVSREVSEPLDFCQVCSKPEIERRMNFAPVPDQSRPTAFYFIVFLIIAALAFVALSYLKPGIRERGLSNSSNVKASLPAKDRAK